MSLLKGMYQKNKEKQVEINIIFR